MLDKIRKMRMLPLVPMFAAGMLSGCGDFSPTTVNNPNLTDKDFLGTTDAGRAWLRGVERQFLSTLNNMVQNSELMSDNYYNNYTTNNQYFDMPRIDYIDGDVNSMQSSVARLREVANFGIESVFPLDPTLTNRENAEILFFRGMSNLWAGESFVGLPAKPRGEVVPPETHMRAAIADFEAARALQPDAALRNSYTLVLARAHHRLGDRAKAVQEATALLAASPTFIRNAAYDPINGPGNGMTGVLTSSVNNFQPLPRLDFLDPKFLNRGPTTQSPLAFAKAEEAHMILAEALLAENNVAGAKDRLKLLLALVQSRPMEQAEAVLQKRGRAGGKVIYPNTSDTRVAFSPTGPLLTGYILTRGCTGCPTVRVPTVSGTSVTTAQIDAITTVDDALYVLYLMRQEIFIAEGRRAADLGIRAPVSLTEVTSNNNVDEGDPSTKPQIPPFIPLNIEMDAFTYDPVAKTVIIKHDMNRVLVQNKTSPFVLPFH